MPKIIQYKASVGVTGISQVAQWDNNAGASLHLLVGGNQYAEEATENLNGTGNNHKVIRGKDNSDGSYMQTDSNVPDLSAGMTLIMLASQKQGNVCNDVHGTFVQGSGIYLARRNGDNYIQGSFGYNTTTRLEVPVGNGLYYIICLRSDGVNQYLSINGGAEATSADVNTFTLLQKLSLFGQFPANKSFVEFNLWDECLSGTDLQAEIQAIAQAYLALPPTTAVINFPVIAEKEVGDPDIDPQVTSNSPAPIALFSNNTNIATIVNGKIHIVGAGQTLITAQQQSTTGYSSAVVSRTLIVNVPVTPPPGGGSGGGNSSTPGTSSAALKGLWYLDGMDLFETFGFGIEKGSADLLRYPPKKESITHDWLDQHGVEVDLSKVFFAPRDISLQCFMMAEDETTFWNNHDAFIAQITKPNLHRLELTAHGNRQYMVYYKECANYTQLVPVRGIAGSRFIGHRFTLNLVEPEPNVKAVTIALVDDAGRFIVT